MNTVCMPLCVKTLGEAKIFFNLCAQVLNAYSKDDCHQKQNTGELASVKILDKNYKQILRGVFVSKTELVQD